jgi:spore coat polysaccharide biosynthesis protein SpsF
MCNKFSKNLSERQLIFFINQILSEKMNLAIIQARMDSTRLPGKVLLPILDKPVLWHIFNRLTFSKKIDKICISTSNRSIDDPIATFSKENKIDCFRGSADDLISRHLGAANMFDGDILIRVTADDPLVDPQIIDQLILEYEKNSKLDFVSNREPSTFPVGLEVEVFPKKTLEKFSSICTNKIFYEFFISNYIFENSDMFVSKNITLEKPEIQRWTLDYVEDYIFIKQIFSHLYKFGEIFNMHDILKLLKNNPDFKKINSMHYSEFSHLKYQQQKLENKNDLN